MKCNIYIVFLFLFFNRFFSQNLSDTIKKYSIDINDFKTPNNALVERIKNYKCISIGEMHGTNEPSEFLVYLVKLLKEKNRKVLVCFEIAENLMQDFIDNNDSLSLLRTSFFKNFRMDGKNSSAWYSAIKQCLNMNSNFCFFEEYSDIEMYSRIIKKYEKDTCQLVITLGGNVHNRIVNSNGEKKMGYYLKDYFGAKYLSIDHYYSMGTMYNLTKEGLKVHDVQRTNNIFEKATDFKNYFMECTKNDFGERHNGILYTKMVTASTPLQFNK